MFVILLLSYVARRVDTYRVSHALKRIKSERKRGRKTARY